MRLRTGPPLAKLLLAISLSLVGLPISAQSPAQSSDNGSLQINLGNSAAALTDWKFHPGRRSWLGHSPGMTIPVGRQ